MTKLSYYVGFRELAETRAAKFPDFLVEHDTK